MRKISAVSLNGLALVGAGLAYLQFNPSAAIHLTTPEDQIALTVVQVRYANGYNENAVLRAWLNHRQGERKQESIPAKRALSGDIYLEGKPILWSYEYPELVWRKSGNYLRQKTDRTIMSAVGWAGFNYGVNGHIYDQLGLADPFVARLKVYEHNPFLPVAHWTRAIAPEYFTKSVGQWQVGEDYQLLAQDISLATRSPNLWTKERWQAIWRLISDQYTLPAPQDVLRLHNYFYLFRKEQCPTCLLAISVFPDNRYFPLQLAVGRYWWSRQIDITNAVAVLINY